MAHADRTPITPLRPLNLDRNTSALVPPLEAVDYSGTEIVCHKCGAVEDARDFECYMAQIMLEHDLCFGCFFDDHEAPQACTEAPQPAQERKAA